MPRFTECHDSDSNSDSEAAFNSHLLQLQSQIASLETDLRTGQEAIDDKLESILALLAAPPGSVSRPELAATSHSGSVGQLAKSPANELVHHRDFSQERSMLRHAAVIGNLKRGSQARSIWSMIQGSSGKISRFLEAADSSTGARLYSTIMTTMILLCTIVNLLQAQGLFPLRSLVNFPHHGILVDVCFNTLFTGELAVRYTVAPSSCMFFRSLYNLNDMFVITASLICALSRSYLFDARVFLHLLPALQFLKLIRRFRMFHLLVDGFGEAIQALPFLIYILMFIILFFGGLIDTVEENSNIPDLLTAMWYVLVTISTVGYGDYTAKTAAGKCITSLLIVIGILYVAVPVGIVGNAFGQAWTNRHVSALRSKLKCWFTLAGLSPMDLPTVWGHFDMRGAGSLDFVDFSCMLDDLHMDLSRSDARKLFRLIDKKGKGGISAREAMKELFPKTYEGYEDSLRQIGKKQSTSASSP
eukprot:TRINITY_DN61610_c0_g1_i1.p1 TRINITY_DN61610_c0_g1~~TRINITY_DN61610_c0_g1_i1.p1  ORF type:complete len:473 (-),score=51.97 TRINITY_DN61610_c0_g1_i1:113-1531(-)